MKINVDDRQKELRSHYASRALIPDTPRDPSSQPVPPFLPFPGFFCHYSLVPFFRNRYVQLRRYSCFFSRSERSL